MALPNTIKFSKVIIKLGDGADPEVFSAPCGLTTKGIQFSSSTSDTTLADCADPEAASWLARAVSGLSGQISGSGVLALESLAVWRAWFESGASKNIQIILDDDAYGGQWEGAAIISAFNINVQLNADGNRAQVSVTIDSDGAWTWTDA